MLTSMPPLAVCSTIMLLHSVPLGVMTLSLSVVVRNVVLQVMGEGVLSREWDLQRGRVWCVGEDSPGAQAVLGGLERDQEVAVGVEGEKGRVSTLQSLIAAVQRKW